MVLPVATGNSNNGNAAPGVGHSRGSTHLESIIQSVSELIENVNKVKPNSVVAAIKDAVDKTMGDMIQHPGRIHDTTQLAEKFLKNLNAAIGAQAPTGEYHTCNTASGAASPQGIAAAQSILSLYGAVFKAGLEVARGEDPAKAVQGALFTAMDLIASEHSDQYRNFRAQELSRRN